MFLKVNIQGKDALNLTQVALKKKPGSLYVSNESVVDKIKDKYLNKDKIALYAVKDEKVIIKKEKGKLESQAFYTKAEQDEIEFVFYSIADALEFSFDFGGYINPQEYAAGTNFAQQIQNAYRPTLKTETEDFKINVLITSLYSHFPTDKLVSLWEGAGFEAQLTPLNYAEDIPLMKEYRPSTYKVVLKYTGSLDTFMKKLIILLSVSNYSDMNAYITDNTKDKYIRLTDGWIQQHPMCTEILNTLLGKTNLLDSAKEELAIENEDKIPKVSNGFGDENGTRLHEVVLKTVLDTIQLQDGMNIVDYGCGKGFFCLDSSFAASEQGIKDVQFVGIDSSLKCIEAAQSKVKKLRSKYPDVNMPRFIQGSLFYTDERVAKADVALLLEVIEHNPLYKVENILDNVFRQDPHKVIITTPNRDYNVNFFSEEYPNLNPNGYRHWDHRFEMNKEEFEKYMTEYIDSDLYTISFQMIGKQVDDIQPTMMAIIEKRNWEKPTEYNSAPNEIFKYEKAYAIYTKKLERYKRYEASPSLFIQEEQLKIEQAQEAHKAWVEERKRHREERRKRIQEAKENCPVLIDPFLVGDALELLSKEKFIQDADYDEDENILPTVKLTIPEEPVRPYVSNIVVGQIGNAFKPSNSTNSIEDFIKHKCKSVKEVEQAREIYKAVNEDMKAFRIAYWKWHDQFMKERCVQV